MATKRNSRPNRASRQSSTATPVIGSNNPLSFSDIADAGIIRKMHIVLANGKEGELQYKAMSVRESREFSKAHASSKESGDPEQNINSTKKFLADHLINPDGSQFATEDQLDNIAIDDLMVIFTYITNSMSGNVGDRGKDPNASETTVN